MSDMSTATPVTTITRTLVDSCNRDWEGDKKEEFLRVCRMINSATPGVTEYFGETADLPDAFMVFSLYDKLRFTEMLLQSTVLALLDNSASETQSHDNVEVDLARKNIKLVFQNIENSLRRLRDIAPNLSLNPPPRPVAGLPGYHP